MNNDFIEKYFREATAKKTFEKEQKEQKDQEVAKMLESHERNMREYQERDQREREMIKNRCEYAELVSEDSNNTDKHALLVNKYSNFSGYWTKRAPDGIKKLLDDKDDNCVKAMKVYSHIEKDLPRRKEFAAIQLDKFSATCTGTLDTAEKERIQEVVIGIMTPLCKNEDEKEALKANAGKMVRECASEAGANKSWSQAWNTFKDKVKNVVNLVMGRENKAAKIMKDHPEIKDALVKAMKQQPSKEHNNNNAVKHQNKSNTR